MCVCIYIYSLMVVKNLKCIYFNPCKQNNYCYNTMYQDALELKIFFQIGNKGLFLLIEIVLISLYHGNPRLEGKSEGLT